MIYCVWYPGGGFGHFINAIISLAGKGFARPANSKYSIGENGNSHNLELAAPKYLHNRAYPAFVFDPTLNYSVLIDNGIQDESTIFKITFPTATVIKICYTDEWWPVIANTTVVKAMQTNLKTTVSISKGGWNTSEDWAVREKYFLYLAEHHARNKWKDGNNCLNLHINDLLDYTQLSNKLLSFGIALDDFEKLWQSWHDANYKYFKPVIHAKEIISAVQSNKEIDISNITDLWDQAVVNYHIWLTYNVEVPANDYANWFTNTKDIAIMLNKLGVTFDSN